MTATEYTYEQAFSRNIGWLTSAEQALLRGKKIAIGGLGGVGGSHLLTLSRLGIGAFHIADFDTFDLPNFNRQAGATVSSLGLTKARVLGDMARGINPGLDLTIFEKGVTPENLAQFLAGVDLYVDGLDFFAFAARKMVFAECTRRAIPAMTVAPLGMGAALLNFMPDGMTFEEYFRWSGCSEHEMALRFLVGLAPALLQRVYLVDRSKVDLKQHKGPSTAMACELCSGIAATEALKILLKRGPIIRAPHGVHFDAYRNKLKRTWRPWGNANPLQRIALAIARYQLRNS
jgi:molybdopterin/thiamine biosynthesis adenylyltransferase